MVELECLPYGIGHADEGSCLLIRMGPYRILLDCGLEDLSRLRSDFEQNLPVDLVLCSHAHPDHARGLLEFHQAFPQVPIYASEVTTQLLSLNWPETAPADLPLFCQALSWRSPVEFRDGLSAELWPAGHLPGAAAFLLTYTPPRRKSGPPSRSYTVFYTGDFFLSNSRLVEGMPLEELRGLKPDVLILEGTYGTARHPRRRQQENQLAERISRAIANQQSVLLPTPYLGLGQELLMLLRSHHHFTGRDVEIWVDETVATACDIYLDLLPHLPSTVQNFAQHQPLFWDERVRPYVRRLQTSEHYQSLGTSPCVVLTHETVDFSKYCRPDNGPWVLLLPQSPRLEGRGFRAGILRTESQPDFALLGFPSAITIEVETYLLAEHCDGPSTTQLIHNLRPQHVVFMHGSSAYLTDLASLDELQSRYHLHTPSAGTLVELPVGEMAIQSPAPESNYEGELTETGTVVTITLPDDITADPRWHTFADTGLVEVRWQGEELVLRGLTQWELLSQNSHRLLPDTESFVPPRSCCGNCQHYRGQRCWNQASPLAGLKVTPEGYCPVFEAKVKDEE